MFDLDAAKQRAEEYLNKGDNEGALASFMSDLNKIEGRDYSGIQQLGMMLLMTGNLDTSDKVRKFIQGTN